VAGNALYLFLFEGNGGSNEGVEERCDVCEEVFVREGDGSEVMDFPMNVVDVEGVRDDFLEPEGCMKIC
jgi:hypothetical protein